MKYAMLFTLQGVLLLSIGLSTGWPGVLLVWASISFLVVAAAYGFGRPAWLGKSREGTITISRRVALAPFHLMTWMTWRAMCVVERRPPYHQIHTGLLVGRRIAPQDLPAHVTHVLDLTSEFQEPRAIRTSRHYMSVSTLDATPVDIDSLRTALEHCAHEEDTVLYIHCAQGHGRTGFAAAFWLGLCELAKTPEEAISMLQAKRPHIQLNASQMSALEAGWSHIL